MQTRYTAQDGHSEFLHELFVEMVTIEALAATSSKSMRPVCGYCMAQKRGPFKGRFGSSAGFPHAGSEADARGRVAEHD